MYSACQSCHGPTGAGVTGPQLSEGEVLLTFPDPKAMMQWIHLGANDWTGSSSPTDYGDPDRPGGPHNTGEFGQVMPGFELSAEDARRYADVGSPLGCARETETSRGARHEAMEEADRARSQERGRPRTVRPHPEGG